MNFVNVNQGQYKNLFLCIPEKNQARLEMEWRETLKKSMKNMLDEKFIFYDLLYHTDNKHIEEWADIHDFDILALNDEKNTFHFILSKPNVHMNLLNLQTCHDLSDWTNHFKNDYTGSLTIEVTNDKILCQKDIEITFTNVLEIEDEESCDVCINYVNVNLITFH